MEIESFVFFAPLQQDVAHAPAVTRWHCPDYGSDVRLFGTGVTLLKAVTCATPFNYSTQFAGDDNYYIISAVGTTGNQKGVQISHDNLCYELEYFRLWLEEGVTPASQLPYSFDLSVMDLYPTLVLGGTLKATKKKPR